jgi:hypothetical protein
LEAEEEVLREDMAERRDMMRLFSWYQYQRADEREEGEE